MTEIRHLIKSRLKKFSLKISSLLSLITYFFLHYLNTLLNNRVLNLNRIVKFKKKISNPEFFHEHKNKSKKIYNYH